ncbi:hypothetical protein K2173_014218 [Erythroxylum novogranatense]|uniref:Single-stranded DNA binding protein Ssb-like OB fold domain-containing protein n=1 Tax=Erythroxylum novogranatense TaxID=1862640 RepID=A0AAV8SE61_9ROSI|nr:hypothetical protein K2173_014218 [Erythroxylum novogranatense]
MYSPRWTSSDQALVVTLTLKVVSAKMALQKGRADGPQIRQMKIVECLIGHETRMIIFTTRNDQDGFPFEIEDIPGERTVLLKRKYLDETTKVEVDMPNVEVKEGTEDDDNIESNAPPSVPLVLTISKDNNSKFLEIGVTTFPDEISIDSLTIKDSSISEDQLAYEGPEFKFRFGSDLDENLQKAFHKYLEIRGIKPSTTNFLLEYMTKKDNREYLKWLNNDEKVAHGN